MYTCEYASIQFLRVSGAALCPLGSTVDVHHAHLSGRDAASGREVRPHGLSYKYGPPTYAHDRPSPFALYSPPIGRIHFHNMPKVEDSPGDQPSVPKNAAAVEKALS